MCHVCREQLLSGVMLQRYKGTATFLEIMLQRMMSKVALHMRQPAALTVGELIGACAPVT